MEGKTELKRKRGEGKEEEQRGRGSIAEDDGGKKERGIIDEKREVERG